MVALDEGLDGAGGMQMSVVSENFVYLSVLSWILAHLSVVS